MMQKVMSKISLNGLTTLVTGSASALGSQVRQQLALKGSKVLAVDLKHKTIEEDIEQKLKVSFIKGDVCDPLFLTDLFKKYPKCDAVVNCAAAYKSYNYLTSYLVAKHALDVMKNNDLNKFGVRGCVINIIGMQEKYDSKYFEEQDIFAKRIGESFESVDEKVMALAQQMTDHRIRANSILLPPKSDLTKFAHLIQNIIEDQYIAGQIINMEVDYQPYYGTWKEITSEYHVPPDPKSIKLPEVKKQNEELMIEDKSKIILKLESDTKNKSLN